MLLARKGYRVLLTTAPRSRATACGSTISTRPGIARLKRWGLLERLIATNCPPIRERVIDYGDFL